MKYKFIKNERACIIKEINGLIIGDLHLGIEKEYLDKGLNIGNLYVLLQQKINQLIEKYSIEKLIFLGDFKHQILLKEKEKIKLLKFVAGLAAKEIFIVKGNHDGNLEKIFEKMDIKIFSSKGFSLANYGFFHGNSWPCAEVIASKYAFCSHLHPKIWLPEDSKKFEIDVFIVCKPNKKLLKKKYSSVNLKEIIILPPFNPFVGGISINEGAGIIKKICDFSKIEIYSIKGELLEQSPLL